MNRRSPFSVRTRETKAPPRPKPSTVRRSTEAHRRSLSGARPVSSSSTIGLAMVSICCSRSSRPPDPASYSGCSRTRSAPRRSTNPCGLKRGAEVTPSSSRQKGRRSGSPPTESPCTECLGRSLARGRWEAKKPAWRGGAGTGGRSSSTMAATSRSPNEWDRPRTSSFGRRDPVSPPVRLPDRRRTVGGGMGRHARWAALPGHEPAPRRACIDCDRHQLGRRVIDPAFLVTCSSE